MNDPTSNATNHDSDEPANTQQAWHAVVHLVIPAVCPNGGTVDSLAAAYDHVAETLRDLFLDWEYARTDEHATATEDITAITVCEPYVEGNFLMAPEMDVTWQR